MSDPTIDKLLGLATDTISGRSTQDDSQLLNPALGYLQGLLGSWLKLDLTTLAAMVTIFGMIYGALTQVKGFGSTIYWFFIRIFTSSLSIKGNDLLNREILKWLSINVLERQGTRILTAGTQQVNLYERDDGEYLEETDMPVQYLPTFGTTWFMHQGNFLMVRRLPNPKSKDEGKLNDVPDEYASAPTGNENLLIMCLGRSVAPLKNFVQTMSQASKHRKNIVTKIILLKEYWDDTVYRPVRRLETVHFDEATKTDLVEDIRAYLKPDTRKFYTDRGIPYRRGYLLHGPPGTGKSSLSLALAGEFELDLYLLHLPSVKDDETLQELFTQLPPKCIVLLEDIDAVGIDKRAGMSNSLSLDGKKDNAKETTDEDDSEDEDDEEAVISRNGKESTCTLSGLLNVLDGVAAGEGRIVLMTSNRAHLLDKALVRSGRIDKKVYLGNISQRSAELMFLRMYNPRLTATPTDEKHLDRDEPLKELALDFSKQIPELEFSPALLQGYLLNYRDNPAAAITGLPAWVAAEEATLLVAKQLAEKQEAKKAKRKAERAKELREAKEARAKRLAAERAKVDDKTKETVPDTADGKETEETVPVKVDSAKAEASS